MIVNPSRKGRITFFHPAIRSDEIIKSLDTDSLRI